MDDVDDEQTDESPSKDVLESKDDRETERAEHDAARDAVMIGETGPYRIPEDTKMTRETHYLKQLHRMKLIVCIIHL